MLIQIRIRIHIQGFDDQKIWKHLQLKYILYFFHQNCNLFIPMHIYRTSKLHTGEVFIPQKKTSGTSKFEFSSLSWVISALLDPDPYSRCGSGSGSSRPKWRRNPHCGSCGSGSATLLPSTSLFRELWTVSYLTALQFLLLFVFLLLLSLRCLTLALPLSSPFKYSLTWVWSV